MEHMTTYVISCSTIYMDYSFSYGKAEQRVEALECQSLGLGYLPLTSATGKLGEKTQSKLLSSFTYSTEAGRKNKNPQREHFACPSPRKCVLEWTSGPCCWSDGAVSG